MFIHLHTHSHYSLLDGLGTIDQLIEEAKNQGATSLALTDHGTMYGVIEFYQKCKKADIKPIIGVEVYITPGNIKEKNREKLYHLILLAKNETGYKNLLKLTTIAHLEGFYYKPRLDWETLKKHSEGLIATTACLGGPISRHLKDNQIEKAEDNLKVLLDIFGKENLYLELQHLNHPDQHKVNNEMKKLSTKYNVPMIITNDIHYTKKEDDEAQDILLCIQTKHKQSDTDRMSYIGEDFSMITEEQVSELFPDNQEAIENTNKIAERCNVEIKLGEIQLPEYELPDGVTEYDELERLCYKGLENRFNVNKETADKETIERLEYELSVIKETGYPSYFLIVQDFVVWAKEQKIVVGPGRGSAAGSLVSYLLEITNIDPLKYKLIFERFLNPERVSMPDIDLDFADTRREEVIRYVEEKYGKDHVAQIITFGTMAARAAIRDVGRVLGYSYNKCDQVAKMVPMFTSLKDALENVDELKKAYEEDPETQRLLDMSQKLEGLIRHSSTHACAVLITKEPLVNYTPLQYSSSDDESTVSQYSMKPVEDLGLLKMDFLGLKNLTIIEQTLKIVEATQNIKIDIDNIPLNNEKTFKLLQDANTTGVFQLESGGMKRYLKELRPTELEDIIAMVALYRPGPMEVIPEFIDRKHGRKEIIYLHPKLEPILKNTYGAAIYQEQIMQIARELARFTYGQADVLRKAVGKKIKELLDQQEESMISGMVNNGIDKKSAITIWEFILPFARYGFNRSHAACYALIAYQTAYLKANYPNEFMASLLTSDQGNTDRITIEINECNKMGIDVLQPDINESFGTFTVVLDRDLEKLGKKIDGKQRIRFGLNAIKNVGKNITKVITEERKKNGYYKSLEDLLTRITDKDLNKKSLESLIKSGALDSLIKRGEALGNLNTILDFNKKIQNDKKSGQDNLFSGLPLDEPVFSLKLEEFPNISRSQRLSWEKSLLGLYLSDHPFKEKIKLMTNSVTTLDKLKNKEGETVQIAGIVTNIEKINTSNGKAMLFVTLEDSTDIIELLIFPKVLQKTIGIWEDEVMLLARGKVSNKDGQVKLLTETVKELEESYFENLEIKKKEKNKLWLNIPDDFDKDKMIELKEILKNHKGLTPVYLILNNGKVRKVKTELKIMPNDILKEEIVSFLGKNSWQLENN